MESSTVTLTTEVFDIPRAPRQDTQEIFASIFITTFQELIAPTFEKVSLCKTGRYIEAVSIKPSGIWYAYDYFRALRALGDALVPVRSSMIPANILLKKLRNDYSFFYGRVPDKYFNRVASTTPPLKYERAFYKVKENTLPAEAFKSLNTQLTFIDCGFCLLDTAYYLFLIKVYGEERFNEIAKEKKLLSIGRKAPVKEILPMDFFYKNTTYTPPSSLDDLMPTLKLGDLLYLDSHPLYIKKHKGGSDCGINLLFVGRNEDGFPLFTGLGLNPRGVTLRESLNFLREGFNAPVLQNKDALPDKDAQELDKNLFHLDCTINGRDYTFSAVEIIEFASGTKVHTTLDKKIFKQTLLPHIESALEEQRALEQLTFDEDSFEGTFNPLATAQSSPLVSINIGLAVK